MPPTYQELLAEVMQQHPEYANEADAEQRWARHAEFRLQHLGVREAVKVEAPEPETAMQAKVLGDKLDTLAGKLNLGNLLQSAIAILLMLLLLSIAAHCQLDGVQVQKDGVKQGQVMGGIAKLNFTGAVVSCSGSTCTIAAGSNTTVSVPYKGAYSSGTTYAAADVVTDGGSSYVSLQSANLGHATSNTTWWGLLAAKGDTGATGSAGATGATGAAGAAGVVAATLPITYTSGTQTVACPTCVIASDLSTTLAAYLTSTTAASTYLTQASAASTYALVGHNHAGVYEPANANIQTHIASTANPHGVTKAQVGLGNADNTTDAAKPVSTAQQAALDLKLNANDASVTNARTPTAHTQTMSTITDAGNAATKNVGTIAGTVAAGDDSRITGALQASALNAALVVSKFGAGTCSGYLKSDGTCATPSGSVTPAGSSGDLQTNNGTGGLGSVPQSTFAAASHTQAESTITFTDVTTNNVSTTAHGYTPKLPNDATKYLNGAGAWTTPSGGGGTANPVNLKVLGPGTAGAATTGAYCSGGYLLGTYTLPGGTLATGDTLVIDAFATHVGTTDAARYCVAFGSLACAPANSTSGTDFGTHLICRITATSSSAQLYKGWNNRVSGAGESWNVYQQGTAAVNTAANVVINVYAYNLNSTDTFRLDSLTVTQHIAN